MSRISYRHVSDSRIHQKTWKSKKASAKAEALDQKRNWSYLIMTAVEWKVVFPRQLMSLDILEDIWRLCFPLRRIWRRNLASEVRNYVYVLVYNQALIRCLAYSKDRQKYIKMENEKSKFFYGHFTKAEINNMCKNGMGSPTSSPGPEKRITKTHTNIGKIKSRKSYFSFLLWGSQCEGAIV